MAEAQAREEAWADVAYQAMLYRIREHGESPQEAAVSVREHFHAILGIEIEITPLTGAAT